MQRVDDVRINAVAEFRFQFRIEWIESRRDDDCADIEIDITAAADKLPEDAQALVGSFPIVVP